QGPWRRHGHGHNSCCLASLEAGLLAELAPLAALEAGLLAPLARLEAGMRRPLPSPANPIPMAAGQTSLRCKTRSPPAGVIFPQQTFPLFLSYSYGPSSTPSPSFFSFLFHYATSGG